MNEEKLQHEFLRQMYQIGYPCSFAMNGETIKGRAVFDVNSQFIPDDGSEPENSKTTVLVLSPLQDNDYGRFLVEINRLTFENPDIDAIFKLYNYIVDLPDDWKMETGSFGSLPYRVMKDMIRLYLTKRPDIR